MVLLFSASALVAALAFVGTAACIPTSSFNGNWRIQTRQSVWPFPQFAARNVWVIGNWVADQAGAVGSATVFDNYPGTTENGLSVCLNCRANATWYFVFHSGPCNTESAGTHVMGYQQTVQLDCTSFNNEWFAYQSNSSGYLATSVPEEWESGSAEPPEAGGPGTLIPAEGRDSDTALQPDGDGIDSPSGQYHLQYQGDGNLVLYDTWNSWTAVWATMTNDNNPGAVVMQGDGNLVIYNGDSEAVWATGTDGNSNA